MREEKETQREELQEIHTQEINELTNSTITTKIVCDTNVLMSPKHVDYLQELINNSNETNNPYKTQLIIPITVTSELDNHNHGDNEKRKWKARVELNFLKKNKDKIKFGTKIHLLEKVNNSDNCQTNASLGIDNFKNDNLIIACAKENNAKLFTLDMTMSLIAEQYGVELYVWEDGEEKSFKGYRVVEIDNSTDEGQQILAQLYESPEHNLFDLYANEYLIIRDKSFPEYNADTDEFLGYKTIDILKWNGSELVKIKQTPKKIVKPMNDLQKCELELLLDKNTTIKNITGTYGSGKTLISTRIGVHLVEDKGEYSKLYMVRNPVGSGEEIGFLPGSKEEKIRDFFKPIMQHFPNSEYQVEEMFKKGSLEMEIPYFLKGLSIGQAYIICDESEDLDVKTIKLIGSRLEHDSCIVFCGDHNQAERQFKYNNGLLYIAQQTKNNELEGTETLDLDVRSDASKVFACL